MSNLYSTTFLIDTGAGPNLINKAYLRPKLEFSHQGSQCPRATDCYKRVHQRTKNHFIDPKAGSPSKYAFLSSQEPDSGHHTRHYIHRYILRVIFPPDRKSLAIDSAQVPILDRTIGVSHLPNITSHKA